MTLEEAILHAEEVEEEMDYEYQECVSAQDYLAAKQCGECAEQHKQLAEWLKDYKRLLEKESILDKIRAEIEEHAKINYALNVDRANALCWCLDVIDKYKAESKVAE